MYSSYEYEDDIDMHTGTLERCIRAHRYRVIEIHVPGIQGPGVSSGGGDTSDPDDDIATDDDIQDLFPSKPDSGGTTPPTSGDDEGDDDIATDDDIKDLFP